MSVALSIHMVRSKITNNLLYQSILVLQEKHNWKTGSSRFFLWIPPPAGKLWIVNQDNTLEYWILPHWPNSWMSGIWFKNGQVSHDFPKEVIIWILKLTPDGAWGPPVSEVWGVRSEELRSARYSLVVNRYSKLNISTTDYWLLTTDYRLPITDYYPCTDSNSLTKCNLTEGYFCCVICRVKAESAK